MPWLLTILCSVVVWLWHINIADIVPLSVDEAHYALYAKHLAWSYFDHPPLVGWLQSLALLFGESERALRVIPITLFFCTALLLHSLTKQLYPQAPKYVPFIAVLLLHSGIMLHLMSMAMLPDVPLLLLGLLTIKLTHHALAKNDKQHWILLGIVLGLSGLSKYTAIVLVVPIILLVIARRHLFNGGFYVAGMIALMLITPVIYWNINNDFMSFNYQLTHGIGETTPWQWSTMFKSQLAQLMLFSPLIYIGSLAAVFSSVKHHQYRWLIVWFLPNIMLFLWASGFAMSLPHWTALGWVSILPLTAIYLMKLWQRKGGKYFISLGTLYSIFSVLVFYLALFDRLPIDVKPSPLKDLVGWQQAAQQADRLTKQLASQYQTQRPVLFVENWSQASRIGWYAYPTSVEVLDNRFDQFDLWYDNTSDSGILITLKETVQYPAVFNTCMLVDNMMARSSKQSKLINHFYFYWCQK